MFIYTFVAHPDKERLVGFAVIIAWSYPHAVRLYNLCDNNPHKPRLTECRLPITDQNGHVFVLVSKIPVPMNEEPRVISINWGYTE